MVENPIKSRRLQAGWTQDQLADRAGVTHDNIVRNEQGLFNNPSPAVFKAILSYTGEDATRVLKEYYAWIANKRRSNDIQSAVRRSIMFPPSDKLSNHPFKLWRDAAFGRLSRISFCQMLCLHPATVLKYEKTKQQSMPSQIYRALEDSGMPPSRINYLANLGSEYFRHERQRQRSKRIESAGVDSD